jgi:hypothetical protein
VPKVVRSTLMSLDGAVDDPGRFFTAGREPGQTPEFDPVLDAVIGTQDAGPPGRRRHRR